MFDYLQKYNKLPAELRDKMSDPAVISAIEEIEKKYGVSLAAAVMKVMIKDINDMIGYFMEEFKLSEEKSRALSDELKGKVFTVAADYLGFGQAARGGHTPVSSDGSNQLVITGVKRELPASSADHSNFSLSPDDKKEINELAKKVGSYAKGSSAPAMAEGGIDQIISKARINFGSEELAERFKRILKIYLRGIRDKIETKQTLIKPVESGGLGIDEESAGNILLIADGSLKNLDKGITVKKPKQINVEEDGIELRVKNDELGVKDADKLKDVGARDVGYDFVPRGGSKGPLGKLDTTHELAPPAPSIIRKTAIEPRKAKLEKYSDAPPSAEQGGGFEKQAKSQPPKFYKTEKINPVSGADAKPAVKPSTQSPQSRVFGKSEQGGKIKMEDVKFQPKIMGPIDELKYMQLIDFRRLDADPLKAAEKIKEKISLLDDEYSKRLEGIKAWRLSPVNRLYLKMGASGISRKEPIDAIIEERKSAGKDYLSNQEFEAVISLNRELRF